eukprot:334668-Prymnesium_polylepis.1
MKGLGRIRNVGRSPAWSAAISPTPVPQRQRVEIFTTTALTPNRPQPQNRCLKRLSTNPAMALALT